MYCGLLNSSKQIQDKQYKLKAPLPCKFQTSAKNPKLKKTKGPPRDMITCPNISNVILTGSMLSFRKTMAQHWSHLTKVSLQGSFIATVLAHWINNPSSHAASQLKGPGALEQNAEPVS